MFALVESGSITSFPKGNRGIKIGDYNYPPAVFTLWSESERNAIGIYTVEIDYTNRKNEEWYINTNESYAFGSGKVTGSYGTATAKAIADANAKDSDGNELDPVVVIVGLKTIKKRLIDLQCAGILAPSDWRVIREQETGDAMDSDWKTWRGNVRTKCNSMQTQIGNAANVDALAALFTYTKQEDDSVTRPLGEFPIKE
tara:strand:- start:207 stop:803 length:597 start_codon:yes stop_codon:yes gene_type:complete